MTNLSIKPKLITKDNFKKFGDMITTENINPIEINKKLLSEYNSSSKYVVFAGRLVDNKGINELLDVWTRLNSKILNLKIIGSGENDKFLLEKYDSPSIEFLGHLENNKVKELIIILFFFVCFLNSLNKT